MELVQVNTSAGSIKVIGVEELHKYIPRSVIPYFPVRVAYFDAPFALAQDLKCTDVTYKGANPRNLEKFIVSQFKRKFLSKPKEASDIFEATENECMKLMEDFVLPDLLVKLNDLTYVLVDSKKIALYCSQEIKKGRPLSQYALVNLRLRKRFKPFKLKSMEDLCRSFEQLNQLRLHHD